MKKTKKIITLGLILSLTVGLFTGCGSEKKTVATDGSTSMEKVIGALGEAFQKKFDIGFTYNPTGSGSGIKAKLSGTCDIGLSSRNLKEEEIEQGLEGRTLAYDGIAIIVHPNNSIGDISLEDIAKIYKGELTNWKDLGGEDKEIVVIGREAGSGTRDGFESISKTEDQCKYRQELTSTGDVISTVAKNENAIGYTSLASIKDNVKALKIDGISPSEETIKDKSYTMQRSFLMITKKGEKLSKSAEKFMEYIFSEEAKEIILSAGLVPAE